MSCRRLPTTVGQTSCLFFANASAICRKLRHLADALAKKRHEVCPTVVGNLLHDMGYSLQANNKTREGSKHVDRDAQFEYINTQAVAFLAADEPVWLRLAACLE